MATTKIKTAPKKSVKKEKLVQPQKERSGILKFIFAIGRYFKNAWVELKQVRWTDRKSTWKLTVAVILFTGFFVVLITLLDYLFQLLFKIILK